MMQGIQSKAEGVSRARMLSPDTLDILAADMAEFDTLRAFLDSASSKRFTAALLRDGVLEQTQLSRLTEKNGLLNDAGKSLVENALRGLIVPDYDILTAVPSSVLNKLDRAVPALARLKARGTAAGLARRSPRGCGRAKPAVRCMQTGRCPAWRRRPCANLSQPRARAKRSRSFRLKAACRQRPGQKPPGRARAPCMREPKRGVNRNARFSALADCFTVGPRRRGSLGRILAGAGVSPACTDFGGCSRRFFEPVRRSDVGSRCLRRSRECASGSGL